MEPQRVISLRSENIKRLYAVEVTPDGKNVVVGGKNGQGKSSLIDSIAMAIGGEKEVPTKPIRDGEKTARIVLKTADFIVERHFTEKGSTLTVCNADGTKRTSPQTVLDSLYKAGSFDPVAFLRLDAEKQAETMRKLVGLDFAAINAEAKSTYDGRTLVNADLKVAKMRLAALPPPVAKAAALPDKTLEEADGAVRSFVPARPDTTALDTKLAELREQFSTIEKEKAAAAEEAAKASLDSHTSADRVLRSRSGLASAKEALEAAKKALATAEKSLEEAEEQLAASERDAAADRAAAASAAQKSNLLNTSIEEKKKTIVAEANALLEKKNAVVAETNATNDKTLSTLLDYREAAEKAEKAAKANREYYDAEKAVNEFAEKSAALTQKLSDIAAEKRNMIASAKFPVDSLSFDPDTGIVIYKGFPLDQASSAEQLRVSVAIACAQNPTLRIMLIREGAMLDQDSMNQLLELAKEHQIQAWIERVGEDDFTTVVIEDGTAHAPKNQSSEQSE
jgi:DNA repair exonuclease SbcCD ATPase subunit